MIPHVQRHSIHNDATQFLDAGVKVIAEHWGKGDTNYKILLTVTVKFALHVTESPKVKI